jgi:hypothetical protein
MDFHRSRVGQPPVTDCEHAGSRRLIANNSGLCQLGRGQRIEQLIRGGVREAFIINMHVELDNFDRGTQ